MRRSETLRRALDILTNGAAGHRVPRRLAEEAEELQRLAWKWLRRKGIQGIGIARRTTEGKRLPERVLKVYVECKLPRSRLGDALVPRELRMPITGERLDIDVEAIGRLNLQPTDLLGRRRPVFPGLSLGAGGGAGTLGCLVRRGGEPNDLYVLSNAHVLTEPGNPIPGTPIFQPGPDDGSGPADDIVADFTASVPLDFTPERFPNLADAAIAKLRNPAEAGSLVPHWGQIRGVALCAEGTRVRLAGSRSGVREGVVVDTNFACSFEFRDAGGQLAPAGFRNQVLCTSLDDAPFTRRGDSGAAVLNTANRLVGLHFAGVDAHQVPNGKPGSVFNPIQFVLSALNARLVTEAIGTLPDLDLAPPTESPLASFPSVTAVLPDLVRLHQFRDSVKWRLTAQGLEVDGRIEGTAGELQTVPRVWRNFGDSIRHWAQHYQIPVELIIATICTESHGDPNASRTEPDGRQSVGLMQTLIGTAQDMVPEVTVTPVWLRMPDNAIHAGSAYIDHQRGSTRLDPPKVACAYNAGGVKPDDSPENRWRMRQFPIGSSVHADRFVLWFNDCFRLFERDGAPDLSLYRLVRG